jgi:hypothetical protein
VRSASSNKLHIRPAKQKKKKKEKKKKEKRIQNRREGRRVSHVALRATREVPCGSGASTNRLFFPSHRKQLKKHRRLLLFHERCKNPQTAG